MLDGGQEIGELLQGHIGKTFDALVNQVYGDGSHASDTDYMITLTALALPLARRSGFGAEDRPGFDERRPLS